MRGDDEIIRDLGDAVGRLRDTLVKHGLTGKLTIQLLDRDDANSLRMLRPTGVYYDAPSPARTSPGFVMQLNGVKFVQAPR